ncbi:MAG: CRTAC1 family protein [Chloroflexi bacterium]|nr:CRTAC1 family protein [Chloroflexota bacterium]
MGAYSEDWQVILPERWDRVCPDPTGMAILTIPLGSWSFFAAGPGYYTPLLDQPIITGTALVVQPAATITIEIRDFGGALFSGVEVRLVEAQHKPLLPPAYVGHTDLQGRLEVGVTPGLDYDVLLLWGPATGASDGTAFFVHAGTVAAGSALHYQMRADQLARISFSLTNGQGTPGPRSALEVKYPHLSLDFTAWFQRGYGSWWDPLQLWVSPEPLVATAHEFADDWHFIFSNDVLEPQAGQTYPIAVGGILEAKTWFYPLLDPGQQAWVQVQDTAGHTLVLRWPSSGSSEIPIRLRDDEGPPVYEGTLDHANLTGWLPLNPSGLQYEVDLDLGFFGFYSLQGQAMDPSSAWPLEPVTTTHFFIYVPAQMQALSATLATTFEQIYAAAAAELGHTTRSDHPHGKIEVHFPFYCDCAGWAGGSTFATMIEYLTYGDALWPHERGAFKAISAHELAHVFQGTGVGLSNYYVAGWFGEYFASFAGALALEDVYGGRLGLHWAILDLQGSNFWLPGSEPSTAYILNGMRRFYTMQAHRDWIQFWAGSDFPNRRCLDGLGLTNAEAIAVGYSYVVGENLGWLFREARFDISDARIQQGLGAIAACVPPAFQDVSETAGIVGTGHSHGAAWGDYDGDSLLDLYVTSYAASDILFRNNGDGIFADVTEAAGLGNPGRSRAAVWGDYDNDGDLDLYVSRESGSSNLWRNSGDGTFADVTAQAGVASPGMSAAWGDYDRDGLLDLLVAHWCNVPSLYHNEGNDTFADRAAEAGLTRGGCGVGAVFGDYDGDGDPDIHLSFLWADNALYRNNGDGTFTDVTDAAGVPGNGGGEGVAWGDYDRDGDLDLYAVNDGGYPNLLYRNNGNGTFTEVGGAAGVADTGIGRGCAWADYDNDGYLDLAVLNWDGLLLYHNQGDGTFAEVAGVEGLDPWWGGNGLAWGDYDEDGDLDLFLTGGSSNALYRNRGGRGNWLNVRAIGTISNRAGIGARVQVNAGNILQVREVSGGSGYHSQDSLPVEFGLGSYTGTVSIVVWWPTGIQQTLTDAAVNQLITVIEGSTSPSSWFYLPIVLRNSGGQ